MVSFYLNQQLITLHEAAPTLSVLEYLRTSLALVGTKEGCAAGDCGACTVVLGELHGDQLNYKAINACITPLGSLHGKQLITVEHLQQGASLHPVQQAMVDYHGSQCGFCTPGVVMSLFAWWKNASADAGLKSRHSVETALSGNLCRCTGYQPIFRAAQSLADCHQADGFSAAQAHTIAQLKALQQAPGAALHWQGLDFFIPRSVAELAQLVETYPQARLVAGATDLGLDYTQALREPASMIYLGNVSECLAIDETDDRLSLGAALTYSAMEPVLGRHFPAFAALLNRLGSLQIRNQGTLGGNVANASPIGDTPPVLLALGASLELTSVAGSRTLPIDTFFTGYRKTALSANEFIRCVHLPKLQSGETLQVYKISKRFDDDISAVCMALWLRQSGDTIVDARLGFGGMAATPKRAPKAEQVLIGKPFSAAIFAAAGAALSEDFAPLDDVRASKAYRLSVAAKLLQRAWLEATRPEDTQLFASHQAGAIAGGFYHA